MANKELQKAVEFYGKEKQCNMAMEEAAELIQAINKCLRYPDDHQRREDLIEEMADVYIMCSQLKIMFNIDDLELDEMYQKKYKRVIDRMHFDEECIKKCQELGWLDD